MDTIKKEQPPIDPLRRIFVPRERENPDGTFTLRTTDNVRYVRGLDGAIRRDSPKVNGKEARKIRRALRQQHKRRQREVQMADPREDKRPGDTKDPSYPSPPDNSKPYPAPGGAGTGTSNAPEKEPAAQPDRKDR